VPMDIQRASKHLDLDHVNKMILHNRVRFLNMQKCRTLVQLTSGNDLGKLKMLRVPTWSCGEGELDFKRFDYEGYCK